MGWIGPAIAAGGQLLGGLLGNSAHSAANRANIKMNKENRDWSEKMSNTGYQRATADMLKAGLNPMLAYSQGPASTPNNQAPTVIPKMALPQAVGAASAQAMQIQQQRLTTAQADTQQETAKQEQMRTDDMKVDRGLTGGPANYYARIADETEKIKQERMTATEKTQLAKTDNEIREIEKQIMEETKGSQVASAAAQANLLNKQISYSEIQTILARLDIPEKEATAKWFAAVGAASPATKAVMSIGQWLKLIFGGK